MDMALSCNNCTLKEKEQVYTAARDGNLLYLKVSRVITEVDKFFITIWREETYRISYWVSGIAQNRLFVTSLSTEPWKFIFRPFCLFGFDFLVFRERLNRNENLPYGMNVSIISVEGYHFSTTSYSHVSQKILCKKIFAVSNINPIFVKYSMIRDNWYGLRSALLHKTCLSLKHNLYTSTSNL